MTARLPVSLSPDELRLRERLERHVRELAGTIGERNIWRYDALITSARYLRETFCETGCAVAVQEYRAGGRSVQNLEATITGASRPGEIVVVGGHYDSVVGCPGANDNATGAAAVLELARIFAGRAPGRTVRFVAFVNEEPPFFQTSEMGSLVYARRCRQLGERIVAMFSLETIGYYSDAEGSQRYPFPFGLVYPGVANFIAFVANIASRGLLSECLRSFRRHVDFPCEGAAAPAWIRGVAWSDHWSFWAQRYPAIMITDTALFRYDPYHTGDDTVEQIEYDHLTRVVSGLAGVVADLCH